jgi:hypothetical protein
LDPVATRPQLLERTSWSGRRLAVARLAPVGPPQPLVLYSVLPQASRQHGVLDGRWNAIRQVAAIEQLAEVLPQQPAECQFVPGLLGL